MLKTVSAIPKNNQNIFTRCYVLCKAHWTLYKTLQLIQKLSVIRVQQQNSFNSYHSLHQWRPVDDALFLDGSPQFHSHSPLQFLAARATGPSQKSTSWTRPCIWFRPTKPTPTLQEWPQKQKQPSMMSATICACIKDLLSLSTATTSFSLWLNM